MPAVDTFISPLSFTAVKLEATLAEPTTAQFRADAERLSHIIMEMQRCFLLHLCKELAPGNVSFSQYFLLAALDLGEISEAHVGGGGNLAEGALLGLAPRPERVAELMLS